MADLRQWTPARVGLGRAGCSLPTAEILSFRLAHAQARDAVMAPIDWSGLQESISQLDMPCMPLQSQASSRDIYIARPDLGRRLDLESRTALAKLAETLAPTDLALVTCDGLSGKAVESWAAPVLAGIHSFACKRGLRANALCLVQNGRVAIGDEIGELLGASLVIVLIGERPGLSCADSLGAYITWNPKVGTTDEARNCISNIRQGGLAPEDAVGRICELVQSAFRLEYTGTRLKEDSHLLDENKAGALSSYRDPAH